MGGGQNILNHLQGKKKKVSKQKNVEKPKKKDKNVKSKKRTSVKSEEKKINEKRKLGKMGKHITNNKNNNKLERKTQKKIKLISKMKKCNRKERERKETGRKLNSWKIARDCGRSSPTLGLVLPSHQQYYSHFRQFGNWSRLTFEEFVLFEERNFKSRLGKFIFRIGH